jgi:hypothetical protein
MPTLQCICSIHFKHQSYFVHSIQSHPCPILLYPIIPLKETKYACGSFFHFDAFRFGRSLLASAPDPFTPLHLHSISHLSSKSKSAAHPCSILHILSIIQILTIHFFISKIEQHTYTQKIKKKAKVSGSPLGCKVKMYF